MATKSATVFLIDCSSSMALPTPQLSHSKNGTTRLDSCLKIASRIIHEKILGAKKNDLVSIVLFGATETKNQLANDGEYQGIVLLSDLAPPTNDLLSQLHSKIKPNPDIEGDAIDALIVSVDMLERFCGRLQYQKKIYLLTDACSPSNFDDISLIADKINQSSVQVNIVCVGLEFEGSLPDETGSELRLENERNFADLARNLLSHTGSEIFSLAEAQDSISSYVKKAVKPTSLYNGALKFGQYEISISVYSKTMEFKPPSLTKMTAGSASSNEAIPVYRDFSYKTTDQLEGDQENSSEELGRSDLVHLYDYGATQVVLTDRDREASKLAVEKGLFVLGFIDEIAIRREYFHSNVLYVTVSSKDPSSASPFYALVHEMISQRQMILAKFVRTVSAPPRLAALIPFKNSKFCGLLMSYLPYSDDCRDFKFAPLIKNQRTAPSREQELAMEDLINSWDLSRKETELDSKLFRPSKTYHPKYHALSSYLHARATAQPVSDALVELSRQFQPSFTPEAQLEKLRAQLFVNPRSKSFKDSKKRKLRDEMDERELDDILSGTPFQEHASNNFSNFKGREMAAQDLNLENDSHTSKLAKMENSRPEGETDWASNARDMINNVKPLIEFNPFEEPDVADVLSQMRQLKEYCISKRLATVYNGFMAELIRMEEESLLNLTVWNSLKDLEFSQISN